jgi:hypothetical protein
VFPVRPADPAAVLITLACRILPRGCCCLTGRCGAAE